MRKRIGWGGPFSFVLVAGCSWLASAALPASAAPVEAPEAARWIAADALVYLEIIRPEVVLDRLSDPHIQTVLTAIPALDRAASSDTSKHLRQVIGVVTGALGTTPEQGLRDLVGARIVLAVEAHPGQGPAAYLIITPRDSAFLARAHAKLLELARQDAQNKGKDEPVAENEYRGVTAYSVNPKEAHAIVKDTLLIASGGDALKAMLERVLDEKGFDGSISQDRLWRARRDAIDPDAAAWALARLDRLREADPKKFNLPDQVNPGAVALFGPWIESFRKAPWMAASLVWNTDRFAAAIDLPTPPQGYADAYKRFLPPAQQGAPGLVQPEGTLLSLGVWRDFSALWEVRADLLPPEAVQNLAKLDAFAGQFFGGRDFGTGVLGALGTDWNLVIARQDYDAMDPVPDVKLPGFALIAKIKPDDAEFSERLKVAFQSFVGIANLDAANKKTNAPPLMLGSEPWEGITISTARYMPLKDGDKKGPVPQRHNFSPCVAQVGDRFILCTSLGLTRDLIKTLKNPGKPSDVTVQAEADGNRVASYFALNRESSVMNNMVKKGNDRASAEKEFDRLLGLLRYLGRTQLSVQDTPETARLRLDCALEAK